MKSLPRILKKFGFKKIVAPNSEHWVKNGCGVIRYSDGSCFSSKGVEVNNFKDIQTVYREDTGEELK